MQHRGGRDPPRSVAGHFVHAAHILCPARVEANLVRASVLHRDGREIEIDSPGRPCVPSFSPSYLRSPLGPEWVRTRHHSERRPLTRRSLRVPSTRARTRRPCPPGSCTRHWWTLIRGYLLAASAALPSSVGTRLLLELRLRRAQPRLLPPRTPIRGRARCRSGARAQPRPVLPRSRERSSGCTWMYRENSRS